MQNQDHAPKSRKLAAHARSCRPFAPRPTRGSMLADVVLVVFWGISIPGLMWLGAAGGF
ncbi:MAG: hypothetical protein GX049_07225 [Alcaligenaceae bacterium]|nr:hypothetical protein [Alcaligenaceae bacterium]